MTLITPDWYYDLSDEAKDALFEDGAHLFDELVETGSATVKLDGVEYILSLSVTKEG